MVAFTSLVLAFLVLGEAFVIYGLLNRILTQAKVEPLSLPHRKTEEPEMEPQKPIVRFSVPFMG